MMMVETAKPGMSFDPDDYVSHGPVWDAADSEQHDCGTWVDFSAAKPTIVRVQHPPSLEIKIIRREAH